METAEATAHCLKALTLAVTVECARGNHKTVESLGGTEVLHLDF